MTFRANRRGIERNSIMKRLVIVFGALCLISSLGGTAAAGERLASEAQGIQRMKAAGSGGSSAGEETCQGAGNCLDLLDRVGAKCKTWICNPGPGGKPNCWCDL
jgi:hypothetical protein